MRVRLRSNLPRTGSLVLALAMALLETGCAAYTFIPAEAIPIAPPPGGAALTCGAGTGLASYTKDKKHRSVYARVQNTGSCPLVVKQKVGGVEKDSFTVDPESVVFSRYLGTEDFDLEINCPAGTSDPATCAGTVTFTPHKKGKPPPGSLTYELRTGDAVPDGTTCETAAQPLPQSITLRNQRKGSIQLDVEVTNTGRPPSPCPVFKLNVMVAGSSSPIPDTNGGQGTPKTIKLGKGRTMTFSVECDGQRPTDTCDGSVSLVAKN